MADGKYWKIDIDEEPENGGHWLNEIKIELETQSRHKPRIQKVVTTLREAEPNKGCFDPMVVSLGPYHHGEDGRLKTMEHYKGVAARWFFSLAAGDIVNLYDKFVAEARRVSSPRDDYADIQIFMQKYSQVAFMKMMFLDGCFVLYFIHLFLEEKSSHLNVPAVIRDMFLLENQIPFTVLKALMSLLPNKKSMENEIEEFIKLVLRNKHTKTLTSSRLNSSGDTEEEPIHLLDFARAKLIGGSGGSNSTDQVGNYKYRSYPFRSIMELKAKGIQVRVGSYNKLKDIKFQEGFLYGYLQLPKMTIDDNTKTSLLNLIAYEMCPDGQSDRAVITYICFLNSLIADDQHVSEDVKELRSKKILINFTGSDQEVGRLFIDLARNLSPNANIYNNVMIQIEDYSKNKVKGTIANFLHTHFRSPWTITIFIAGKLAVVSSVIQGLYYLWRFYR